MGIVAPTPELGARGKSTRAEVSESVGSVADMVLIPNFMSVIRVVPAGAKATAPLTSQSPAVREIEVTFAGVAVVNATAEPAAILGEVYSPTLPAFALPAAAVAGKLPAKLTPLIKYPL